TGWCASTIRTSSPPGPPSRCDGAGGGAYLCPAPLLLAFRTMSALARLNLAAGGDGAPAGLSDAQDQTRQAFGFQWQMRDTFESPAVQAEARRWLVERYCAGDPARLDAWLAPDPDGGGRKLILDAGCGAGYSAIALFGDHLRAHDYLGVDLAPGALATARARFAEHGYPADFLLASVSD